MGAVSSRSTVDNRLTLANHNQVLCNDERYAPEFTLIELMISVAATLLVLAMPSFSGLLSRNNLVTETNNFTANFSLTRAFSRIRAFSWILATLPRINR